MTAKGSPKTNINFYLAIQTSFLLILSFPRFSFWLLAWISLIPLLFAINRSESAKQAFGTSFLAGGIFFFFSMHWLRHVTYFGWIFVTVWLAAYFGIFGLITYKLKTILERTKGVLSDILSCIFYAFVVIPSLWVAIEFTRTEVPVFGLGWNLFAYTQANDLRVAQFAKILGAYGVSFLIVSGNAAIYLAVRYVVKLRNKTGIIPSFLPLVIFGVSLFSIISFGRMELVRENPGPSVRVSVIQGSIRQADKWRAENKSLIVDKYKKLTKMVRFDGPDIIIWPEASYPGYLNKEFEESGMKSFFAEEVKMPVLVGAPILDNYKNYNSALLISPEGEIVERYDKMKLVPFGEYVPLKPILGILEPIAFSFGIGDFSPGNEYTVFDLTKKLPTGEDRSHRFSTLVCFEDTFPGISRTFTEKGAEFLVVITNDAWFMETAAPYQHLAASQFRAIENGVPFVRAANTGVSCFVSPNGEVLDRVKNQKGYDIFVTGGLTRPVEIAKIPTFYKKMGYLFPWVCLVALILTVIGAILSKKKSKTL